MATKKKKKSTRPQVPNVELTAPSEMEAPKYEPMSIEDFTNWTNRAYQLQLQYAPQVAETQRQAQDLLFRNMAGLQREQAPAFAAKANELLKAYNPEFRQTYGELGRNINQGLSSGYDLGPGLDREITQAIRGAQTARGNILGNAPTAQEAFGKGQAALNLYNTRLGQAQGYLQGRSPTDMMGQMAGQFMGQHYYPSQSYVDAGMGLQGATAAGNQGQAYNETVQKGYSSFQGALQNYNANQIEGTFGTYDRQADYWQYDEAVRRGLYSTPQVGGGAGGGGGMGGMMGTAMAGIGTGITTGIGLAAAGAGTGMAAAGGVAAAASAAGAAICWLARRCIPDSWEKFQHYLFTDAPEKLRRFYLYNARRLGREITDDEATEIGNLMNDVL